MDAIDAIELPLSFATAGLVGLGGLAVLMGAALSSLAELLALLAGRGGMDGARASRSSFRSPGGAPAWVSNETVATAAPGSEAAGVPSTSGDGGGGP